MPTIYINIPNANTASIDILSLISASYPGTNCVTASIANLCYGLVTGSYTQFYSGTLDGFYYNEFITGSPAKRNNCTGGKTGSFAIPFVNARQFSSSVSFANANASASTYLAANSQSMVNGTIGTSAGVCFTSGARVFLPATAVFTSDFPTDVDIEYTSNLPLTLSVIATSSLWTQNTQGDYTNVYNSNNWQVVGYYSQSLFASGSFTSWQSDYFNPISGAVFIKATDANGKLINPNASYNQYFIVPYPQQYISALLTPRIQQFIDISEGTTVSSSTFDPRIGLLLEQNLSSSWVNEDHILTYITLRFPTSVGTWTNNNFTASILWTTESSYPSQSDARWTLLGNSKSGSTATIYRTGSFNGVSKVYGISNGVGSTGGISLASTASYSGYTYVKFESGSTLIPNLGFNVSVNGDGSEATGINVAESGSFGDILRFRTRYATGSGPSISVDYWKPDANAFLNVTMSAIYL
jgi:hypothetical protein